MAHEGPCHSTKSFSETFMKMVIVCNFDVKSVYHLNVDVNVCNVAYTNGGKKQGVDTQ